MTRKQHLLNMPASHKSRHACRSDLLREVGQLPHEWQRVLESRQPERTVRLACS